MYIDRQKNTDRQIDQLANHFQRHQAATVSVTIGGLIKPTCTKGMVLIHDQTARRMLEDRYGFEDLMLVLKI